MGSVQGLTECDSHVFFPGIPVNDGLAYGILNLGQCGLDYPSRLASSSHGYSPVQFAPPATIPCSVTRQFHIVDKLMWTVI
jgi:hypothetical protein